MIGQHAQARSLPLQGGGLGWGSLSSANDPLPTAFALLRRSTSTFQEEEKKSAGGVAQ